MGVLTNDKVLVKVIYCPSSSAGLSFTMAVLCQASEETEHISVIPSPWFFQSVICFDAECFQSTFVLSFLVLFSLVLFFFSAFFEFE